MCVLDIGGEYFKDSWFGERVEKIDADGGTSTLTELQPDYGPGLPKYRGHFKFAAGVVLQHAPWATVVGERS